MLLKPWKYHQNAVMPALTSLVRIGLQNIQKTPSREATLTTSCGEVTPSDIEQRRIDARILSRAVRGSLL